MSAIEKNKISANIVFHRKSARRKVSRDIFLVFEKPSKKLRSKRSNKKLKSKKATFSRTDSEKSSKILNNLRNATFSEKTSKDIQRENKSQLKPIPRVNPIFLWVKQENTTIVEVRCEDYDKQNRIRITKTKHGWKAFPRSDSTSSRVVNVIHNPLCLVNHKSNENIRTIDEKDESFPKKIDISNMKVEKSYSEVNCSENDLCSKSKINKYEHNEVNVFQNEYPSEQDISFNLGIFDIDNEELKNSNGDFIISETDKLKELIETDLLNHCNDNINMNSESDGIDCLVKNNYENNNGNNSDSTKNTEIKEFFYSCNENVFAKEDHITNKNNFNICQSKCLPINNARRSQNFDDHMFTEACTKNLQDICQSLTQENEISVLTKNNVNLIMKPINSHSDSKSNKLYDSGNRNSLNIHSNWAKIPPTTCVDSANDATNSFILNQINKTEASKSHLPTHKSYHSKHMDIETQKQKTLNNSFSCKNISNNLELRTITESDSYCSYVHNLVEQYSNANIDPDPLTQLQLLMKNSEWKVPDPILVPKHRLSAILASPAREIPLLLTTLPELSHPKAYNCPEILQNPNILIISMAQLEAILKRNLQYSNFQKTNATQQKFILPNEINGSNNSCTYINSNLSNDFNMESVLKKIIHTPYIERYEPYKCQKPSKNNLYPPFCQKQFEIPNNEIYKNQQTLNHQNLLECTEEPIEVSIFQDICHNQLENYFNMNPLAAQILLRKHETKQNPLESCIHEQFLTSKSYENQVVDNNMVQSNFVAFNKNNNGIPQNLCDSYYDQVYGSKTPASDFHYNKHAKSEITVEKCKPKLTCRSLSKLLEPNHGLVSDFFVNVSSQMNKCDDSFKDHNSNNKKSESHSLLPSEISVSYFDNRNSIKSYETGNQLKLNTNFNTTDAFVKSTDFSDKNSNPVLWHPLFGSKSNSNQWQWTTISTIND